MTIEYLHEDCDMYGWRCTECKAAPERLARITIGDLFFMLCLECLPKLAELINAI